ncbi:disks large homolog 5 isoform X2 [Daphnia magna]|uniref:Disks large 5 n=1 Tax=Daphnia magna TaxID=35525 RepID=A0ABQ9Z3Y8_9CRUS|nr:disks large homolog 5 isoform X2 [Daphnia magna]KAK4007605.1 hypothetical protein OUZ56_012760 [Daphnia magna]
MENADESGVGGNELSLGMNQILCENTSPIGMGPDYDLQQSNLALLKAELKLVTHDRDLLKKELSKIQHHAPSPSVSAPFNFSSAGTLPRSTYSQQLSSVRDYDALQRQCEAAMSELQSLKRQHDRCEKAVQESEYYRGQHRSVLSKLDSTTQEMHTLRSKYGDVLTGKQRLEQEVHSLSQAREEDRKEINDLRRQQQEAVIKGNGTSETLNQLYVSTLRKCEAIKDEHDSLRKRYADLVASHSAAVSKLELAQEEMTRLKKQYEESIQERNAAVRERNVLKSQCTQAIMQWDIAIRERNTYMDYLTKIQLQHEEEINKGMALRMKSNKDLKRLTEERNAAMEEYSLVMRERDSVHKEIEKLQDDLLQSNKKLKTLEIKSSESHDEKKMLLYEVESLRREIKSALDDRDNALKELHHMRERYGEYQEPQWNENLRLDDQERKIRFGIGNGCLGGEQVRKDRIETPKSGRGELYPVDGGDQEVEQLKKQLEKIQTEYAEALQEAEVSKQRRDWAFGERDKIVLERESIRTLCDRLRRERDRAVSDLAEALRDSDDVKRQRNQTFKELKELKEKLGDLQLEKEKEKESRAPLNHSYDSALGTDFSDGDTETVEVELDWSSSLMDFGFLLAGGKNRPVYSNDYGLYVVSVTRGGPADSKLKINDCLLKVGTLSCTAADAESVLNLLRSSKMPVTLTVKRKRCLYQGLYSVKLPLGGASHGLTLESGIYIRSITPGSMAARESSLKVGDRLCSINGRILDSMASFVEVCRILDDSFGKNDGPVITVIRGSFASTNFPVSLPSLGSPSSSSSAHNITEEESHNDVQEQGKVDSHFSTARRHQGSKHSKGSSLSSNAPSNVSSAGSIASAGLVVWDMFRETLGRPKRPNGKEKSNHHTDDGKRTVRNTSNSPIASGTDREAAAIAILEDVIDRYNPHTVTNSDAASISGTHKKKNEMGSGLVTLSRRKRIMGSSKSECKRDDTRMNSGGTWPRCRAGSPFVSGEYLEGANTLFHSYKYPRARLPLSVFIDASKTSKDEVAVDDTTDDDKDSGQTAPSGDYRTYGDRTSMETVDPPSDGSIDLSVQSGNLGKEDLGRYLKKKGNAGCGTTCKADADTEVCRNGQLAPASGAQTLTTVASGLSGGGPVHVHAALPSSLPTHLRIQSQLYPTALHSSLKYKVSPHVGHMHSHQHNLSPPRYSSPTPLPRQPTESPYDFPLGGPHSLLSNKSYSHTQSPSIDSSYSMTHKHSHNHSSVPVPFGYESNRGSHTEYVQLPYSDGIGTVKKEPARIRIPSNPSVTSRNSIGRISTSSVERLSEQGSPMPNFHVEILSPGRPGTGVGSRSSIEEYSWTTGTSSKFKPAPDELRRVYIEKSSEPLGIQIFCRNSGGVFVSSVHQSSLAAQVGLQVGDQLLEVCGINMRSATYQLAACVLHQCGDSITMLVQYNPTKYQELQEMNGMSLMGPPSVTSSSSECDGNGGGSHQRSKSRSGSPTPCNSPRHSRDHSNNSGNGSSSKADVIDPVSASLRNTLQFDRLIDRGSESRSSIVRPPSIHGTLTRHHALATLKRPTSVIIPATVVDENGGNCRDRDREPRLVHLEMKKAHSLGISLVGGNAVGIFIHAVQNESPAFKAGLRCGDRILEFNSVNLRDSTAEQAAYELAKPTEKVTLIVQHDMERYREIAEQPGDSFYVRAQFDKMAFDSHEQMELGFRRDDILHIDNTMFNGVPGLWRAWLVDNEGRKVRCGVIPSKYKIEEELLQRSSLADLDHESRRSSTSARRSFFRRRKHTRSSSRDSKEIASFSDASLQLGSSEGLGLSSIYVQETVPPRPVSYAQVERYDCKEIRPVIIVGPLSDYVVDKLVQEFPRKFVRVMPELMPYPESYMEKNLDENNFIEYRRKGTHYECITVSAVQSVGEKNLHGVLDVSLNAVSRLHNRHCFPIIILLKFKSVKHVREVKDTRVPSDKTAAKAAKEMYEHVIKVEAEHRHLISAVIPAGGNLACLCTQVSAVVEQEQTKILWVPRGSIW